MLTLSHCHTVTTVSFTLFLLTALESVPNTSKGWNAISESESLVVKNELSVTVIQSDIESVTSDCVSAYCPITDGDYNVIKDWLTSPRYISH